MSPPLTGILVLDFSQYIAGPYCGLMLADLGAEVIKIESLHGSEERSLGNIERYKGNTRIALTMNRGKKSVSTREEAEPRVNEDIRAPRLKKTAMCSRLTTYISPMRGAEPPLRCTGVRKLKASR